MKRVLLFLLLFLAAFIILPPVWFAIFPTPKPDLPPPGKLVTIAPTQRVNVIEQGSGPTIVLIHGHPGSAYDWRALMGELAVRGFHTLAYDRVGYGYSDLRQTDDYTVEANADELLGLLDAERLENVTVVGWSYGGGVAVIGARKDPSRMSRLVLVGSVGPGIENRDGPPQLVVEFMAGPGFGWLGLVPPLSKRLRAVLTAEAFAPEEISPRYLRLLDANFARPYTLWTFRHEGRDLGGEANLDPKGIELPMLIIQGDGDRLVPPAVAEELHERAPKSDLWMVKDAGHMLPITHAKALAERIAEFARP